MITWNTDKYAVQTLLTLLAKERATFVPYQASIWQARLSLTFVTFNSMRMARLTLVNISSFKVLVTIASLSLLIRMFVLPRHQRPRIYNYINTNLIKDPKRIDIETYVKQYSALLGMKSLRESGIEQTHEESHESNSMRSLSTMICRDHKGLYNT